MEAVLVAQATGSFPQGFRHELHNRNRSRSRLLFCVGYGMRRLPLDTVDGIAGAVAAGLEIGDLAQEICYPRLEGCGT